MPTSSEDEVNEERNKESREEDEESKLEVTFLLQCSCYLKKQDPFRSWYLKKILKSNMKKDVFISPQKLFVFFSPLVRLLAREVSCHECDVETWPIDGTLYEENLIATVMQEICNGDYFQVLTYFLTVACSCSRLHINCFL